MTKMNSLKPLAGARGRPWGILAFIALLGSSGIVSAQQAPEAITLIGRGSAGSTSDLASTPRYGIGRSAAHSKRRGADRPWRG